MFQVIYYFKNNLFFSTRSYATPTEYTVDFLKNCERTNRKLYLWLGVGHESSFKKFFKLKESCSFWDKEFKMNKNVKNPTWLIEINQLWKTNKCQQTL